jgi:serine phosphatase RsbU (regulator of sigma subunit)
MRNLIILLVILLPFKNFGQEIKLNPYGNLSDTSQILNFIKETSQLPDSLGEQKLLNSKQILEASERLKFGKGIVLGHYLKAESNFIFGDYDIAMNDFQLALELSDYVKNSWFKPLMLFKIGKIHELNSNFTKTLEYYHLGRDEAFRLKNENLFITFLGQIGNVHGLKGDYRTQINYNLEVIRLYESRQDSSNMLYAYNDVSVGYTLNKSYDSAIYFLKKAIEIGEKTQNDYYLTAGYGNLADNYLIMNSLSNSIFYAQKGLKVSKKVNAKQGATQSLYILYESYKRQGNIQKALEHLEVYNSLKDSLYNENQTKEIQKLETNFTIKQKQKENESLQLENQLKLVEIEQQKKIIIYTLVGLVLLLTLSLALIYAWRKLNNTNQLLHSKNKEIQLQKEEIEAQSEELLQNHQALNLAYKQIEQKNQNITDSINYAQRIQLAMLPFKERIENQIDNDNFFIFYKPKDIVSGDFYFFETIDLPSQIAQQYNAIEHKQAVVLAVVDCTGHGVPGAFMSMIANQLLYEIIIKNEIILPNKVLENLNKEVKRCLRQDQNKSHDGMDISLVIYFPTQEEKFQLLYSGAMNPIYLIHQQELTEMKATKKFIGGYSNPINIAFNLEERKLEKHTNLYLLSDGYADQFGGKDKRKFMSKNLKNLLVEVSEKEMMVQHQILSRTIEDFRREGNEKQIDDMTILGVRII